MYYHNLFYNVIAYFLLEYNKKALVKLLNIAT